MVGVVNYATIQLFSRMRVSRIRLLFAILRKCPRLLSQPLFERASWILINNPFASTAGLPHERLLVNLFKVTRSLACLRSKNEGWCNDFCTKNPPFIVREFREQLQLAVSHISKHRRNHQRRCRSLDDSPKYYTKSTFSIKSFKKFTIDSPVHCWKNITKTLRIT